MKKFILAPAVLLLLVFCSGYSKMAITTLTPGRYGLFEGNYLVNRYNIASPGSSKELITPVESIYASIKGESRVYYRAGTPGKRLVTSGSGRIINE